MDCADPQIAPNITKCSDSESDGMRRSDWTVSEVTARSIQVNSNRDTGYIAGLGGGG